MPTTTPNFGWSVPVSTDLVKDGATAIELLGDSIDASLVDLKGGTSGQVLAKNSGTDMDFIWVAQDDSNAIQNAIVDAKGDLIGATAADTPARLAVGTNGQVLTADSTAATGLNWATPAGGGKVLQVVYSSYATETTIASTSLTTTGLTGTITPSSASSKVLILVSANAQFYKLSNIQGVKMDLQRASTTILNLPRVSYGQFAGNTSVATHTTPINYLDEPATTSATTYTVRAAARLTTDSGQIFAQTGPSPSTMILIEIGA